MYNWRKRTLKDFFFGYLIISSSYASIGFTKSLIKQYKKLLELDGVDLEFEKEALDAIVEKAIERNTGARGLRSIIEDIMRDIMFDIPTNPNIEKCLITKETVANKKPPVLTIGEPRKEREAKRQKKYQEYLGKIDQRIKNELAKQAQIYRENNPTTKECYSSVMNLNRNFWARTIGDEDFLRVRLGLGNMLSSVYVQAPQEHFTMDEDNLQEMVYEVDKNSKILTDVPITLDIPEQSLLSFVFKT